jgi:hypothetical protein
MPQLTPTTIQYTTPLDALIALTKQLTANEIQYQLDSADFYQRYTQGQLDDREPFIDWANNYQHYLALHDELASRLSHVA